MVISSCASVCLFSKRQIRQQVLLYELQGIVKQEANDEEIHR
ncbi:hypothetical protein ACKA0G_06530 [Priestia megaterium]